MDAKLQQILENLGLEAKEARIYLATLEVGGGGVLEISRKANVERVNTYYVLDRLIKQGLVYESSRGQNRAFMAISVDKLEGIMQSRLEDLQKSMPILRSIENSNEVKPKISFYEGVEGIKRVFEETLKLKAGEEIVAIVTVEHMYETMQDWVPKYLEKRIKKGITMRVIAEDSEQARVHANNDKNELRESVLVDKDKFPFSNEINIFGDKMMIASYKDLMGVIIESREVANTQRAFFELAWLGAKQVGR